MKNNSEQHVKDDKLKPLIPALRQKKRFVKVKIECERKLDFRELSENLTESIILYLGAIEFAKSGIWLLRDKFDYENQEVIFKVSTKTKDKLIGVLSLIQKIGSISCKIKTLKVSGTLKGVRE